MVLCKDNAYALYTAAGEELIPFGGFEYFLPVYEGCLWDYYNSKWSVLEPMQ